MFACIHAPGVSLLECARDFSPLVEETAPGTVVLDIEGLAPLFGSPQKLAEAMAQRISKLGLAANVMPQSPGAPGGISFSLSRAVVESGPDKLKLIPQGVQYLPETEALPANVAVASNPDAAMHAALGFPGITVIPPGSEAARLGSLPVEILSLPLEIAETLARWGIRTFREFAILPEAGIAERLGQEGVRLQRLARGAGCRPLVPANPLPAYEQAMELEYPVALLEPLSFILARLLNQLSAELESRGLATNELRLKLQLEEGSEHARALHLPFPMRDSRTFLKLLQLDLDSHPPPGPVVGVTLSAQPVNPRVIQNGLFLPLAPEPQKLELTLARIASVVGENNLGAPELLDTHRPDAFRLSRIRLQPCPTAKRQYLHLALRRFRPPLEAQVEAPSGRPARIQARGVRGNVRALAGPWRSSGDWWTPNGWARDDWDVALGNGALYRICFDRLKRGWFVEGSYD